MLVSNAGDWTRRLIVKPKSTYWVRGAPVTGLLSVARLFNRVVIVATGSGISPVLSGIQNLPDTMVRLVWSTRFPWQTYDAETCRAVIRADPNAAIIDSCISRRDVNLVEITYQMYVASNAEAVMVISNEETTKHLIGELRARRIHAMGPVFDS
jgi:ferredoxin-NADP reductase